MPNSKKPLPELMLPYHQWGSVALAKDHPDSKVHGANMGPIWILSVPEGPHVGPLNLAIWAVSQELLKISIRKMSLKNTFVKLHISQGPMSSKGSPSTVYPIITLLCFVLLWLHYHLPVINLSILLRVASLWQITWELLDFSRTQPHKSTLILIMVAVKSDK